MQVTKKIKARLEKSKKLDNSKHTEPTSILNRPTPTADNKPPSTSLGKVKSKFKFGKSKSVKTPSQPATPTEPTISTNKNNRHLICDDAFANRLVLNKYLTLYGCQVDEAENGLDAIDKVKANGTYNVIWMDIKMPKMDGFTCTDHLVSKMKYTGPIIGLTGYVDEETVKKCYALGMTHVLAKPFDKKIIKDYCEKYQNLSVPSIAPTVTPTAPAAPASTPITPILTSTAPIFTPAAPFVPTDSIESAAPVTSTDSSAIEI
jgi:CheY-like chemotaxis protein